MSALYYCDVNEFSPFGPVASAPRSLTMHDIHYATPAYGYPSSAHHHHYPTHSTATHSSAPPRHSHQAPYLRPSTTVAKKTRVQTQPPVKTAKPVRPRYAVALCARKREEESVPNPFLAYAPIVEKALREGRTVRETLASCSPPSLSSCSPPSTTPSSPTHVPNPFYDIAQQIAKERSQPQ